MLIVLIIQAAVVAADDCCVGDTECGRGELSRDDDVDSYFVSSDGCCDIGEDILYNKLS